MFLQKPYEYRSVPFWLTKEPICEIDHNDVKGFSDEPDRTRPGNFLKPALNVVDIIRKYLN